MDTIYGVLPSQLCHGALGYASLPPSKSSLNRLLILAALSSQCVTLKASGWGEDTDLMIAALRALGFRIDIDLVLGCLQVYGEGGTIPERQADLYFGNAGTVARFVSALLTLRPGGRYTLDGNAAMRKRPMQHLWDALRTVGAIEIDYLGQEGCLPCIFKTKGFVASTIALDTTISSQGLSALMMIGGLKGLEIHLESDTPSWPFVEMTAQYITSAGGKVHFFEKTIQLEPTGYHFTHPCTLPLDATAASYCAAWAISTQTPICIHPFHRDAEQGDWQFLDLLEHLGLIECVYSNASKMDKSNGIEPKTSATLTVRPKDHYKPIEANFKAISDTFITLLAIGPLLKAPLKLYGLKHTRFQECDRIQAMADNLRQLGQKVVEHDDSLELWPNYQALQQKDCYLIADYQDHRVAMSFAILGSHALRPDKKPWIYLNNPNLCCKTFPGFFKTLENLNDPN